MSGVIFHHPSKSRWMNIMNEYNFWRAVDIGCDSDCWVWKMYIRPSGYGGLSFKGKPHESHRVAYSLSNKDEDIAGKTIRHTCDNPACCNPKHLLSGTTMENVVDRVSRGRGACGEKHGKSKLIDVDVCSILAMTQSKDLSDTVIGGMFGVNRRTIYDI